MESRAEAKRDGLSRYWLGRIRPQKQLNNKPFFTSHRERRLWGWTLAVVAAIYSTLGLAATLAEFLRNRGLFDDLFVLGLILIGAAILAQGLTWRPRGIEIVVTLGIVATYLLVFARMAIPEERTHLIEYGVVAVFINEALTERASQGRHVPVPALLAVLATAMVGLLDECIQAFLPNRVFDYRDILFNGLAAVMAVAASVALAWARRWRNRNRPK
ncbi:MAG: VanZ family protein [Caldilineaceae bacterium SB0664_bin_22]|nr:VanZ family protein [Caldilineaceae bacterium SB0664_bin_22]